MIKPLFALDINALSVKVHGAGAVGFPANVFVCHDVLAGLKSDPDAISKLMSLVAFATKKLVAFASLVVSETEVPFIEIHWLEFQFPEAEKVPFDSVRRVDALIFVDVAFPTNVKRV